MKLRAGEGRDWGTNISPGWQLGRQVCGSGSAYPAGATIASIQIPESQTP